MKRTAAAKKVATATKRAYGATAAKTPGEKPKPTTTRAARKTDTSATAGPTRTRKAAATTAPAKKAPARKAAAKKAAPARARTTKATTPARKATTMESFGNRRTARASTR